MNCLTLLDGPLGDFLFMLAIVAFAACHVNGWAKSFALVRTWFKRDAQSFTPPHLFTGWEADAEIARRIKTHPMDRTFSDACDW